LPVVAVHLVAGPLGPAAPWAVAGAGALLTFEGVVRPEETGRPLAALDYEAYEPMASRMLRDLAERLGAAHGLLAIKVEHGVGRVPVGAVSFRLRVAAAHRQSALAAVADFIDALKTDVPLWKMPVWAATPAAPAESGA
jgi:molybdopterin synthase catalytic subunit